MFTVKWTGGYPNKCSGEWQITYNGVPVTLPDSVKNESMSTSGDYDRWSFNDDYSEEWSSYHDGLGFDEWLKTNNWARAVTTDVTELRELFDLISGQDWRHGSCGGCI